MSTKNSITITPEEIERELVAAAKNIRDLMEITGDSPISDRMFSDILSAIFPAEFAIKEVRNWVISGATRYSVIDNLRPATIEDMIEDATVWVRDDTDNLSPVLVQRGFQKSYPWGEVKDGFVDWHGDWRPLDGAFVEDV